MVEHDAACRRCSYNLRGLSTEGRCPECGSPVGISICGNLLRYSPPDWLKTVSDGLMLILWGVLASIVVAIIAAILFEDEPLVMHGMTILASLVGLIGAWKMTSPDPAGIGEDASVNARKIVRFAVAFGLAGSLVQMIVISGAFNAGAQVINLLAGIVGIVGELAKLHYIGLLAARLPDDALVKRANGLKWTIGICYGIIVLLSLLLIVAVAGGGAPGGGAAALGIIMIPVGLVLLVAAIMGLFLLYRMAKAIRTQMLIATQIWRGATQKAVQPKQDPYAAG
jgi:hypothetical protein